MYMSEKENQERKLKQAVVSHRSPLLKIGIENSNLENRILVLALDVGAVNS